MYFSYLDYKFNGKNLKFENYLGRVNFISIYPSVLILFGLVKLLTEFISKKVDIVSIIKKVILFNVITTWLFYCSWIVIYNFYDGIIRGVSPVYMLQLVNFFPFLGGLASVAIYKKYPNFYQINLIILSFIFLHNIGIIYFSN